MKEQSPTQIISFIYLLVFLSFGNLNCNTDKNSDEDHICNIQKPAGKEVWYKGSATNIIWVDNQSEFVRIELLENGLPILTIAESAPNSGIYRWVIPENLDENNHYRIELTSLSDKTVEAQSLKDFRIREPFPSSLLVDPRDGQAYKILKIGDRWWMAENLNFITETGSMSYLNNPSYAEKFGRLYLWEAAMIACPEGWEIPSDDDWKALEVEIGLSQEEVNNTGMRGVETGFQLTERGGSGFNALYAGYYRGYRQPQKFGHVNYDTRFWTSTRVINEESLVLRRLLIFGYNGIDRNATWSTNGYSVRCIEAKH